MNTLVLWLLVTAVAELGCMRTTSLGRANGQVDAQADASTDAHADRDGAPDDRDATAAPDAPADMPREAPIIGGGRDASADGVDGPTTDDAL
jgi:hypothetical protein